MTISAYWLLLQHRKMIDQQPKIEELKSEVESLRIRARKILEQKVLELQMNSRLNHLRETVERQDALLEEERKVIEKRKLALLSACDVIKECITYNNNKKVIDAIDSYHADRMNLQKFDRKLRLRQHKMCRQLLHIFPFRRVRNASNSTNNLCMNTPYLS